MPIGKNAIKRVADNGYSNVKSAAPDMENSTVIANLDPQVEQKLLPKTEAKKPAARKTTAKSTAAKSTANSPDTEKKAKAVKKPAAKKDGFERCGLGEELPTHLL